MCLHLHTSLGALYFHSNISVDEVAGGSVASWVVYLHYCLQEAASPVPLGCVTENDLPSCQYYWSSAFSRQPRTR